MDRLDVRLLHAADRVEFNCVVSSTREKKNALAWMVNVGFQLLFKDSEYKHKK